MGRKHAMMRFEREIFTSICRDYLHFCGYHRVAGHLGEKSATSVAVAKKALCRILMVFLVSVTIGALLLE